MDIFSREESHTTQTLNTKSGSLKGVSLQTDIIFCCERVIHGASRCVSLEFAFRFRSRDSQSLDAGGTLLFFHHRFCVFSKRSF